MTYSNKEKKVLNLLMAANDRFFYGTITTLLSVRTNSDAYIRLFFAGNINDKNKMLLHKYADEIIFLDSLIDIFKASIDKDFIPNWLSIEAAYRCFLPFFIECDKLIWLDSDLIVRTDLFECTKIDLCGKSIGVAEFYKYGAYLKDYFNSGFIIFNMSVLKSRYSVDDLFSLLSDNSISFALGDETLLNYIFKNDKYVIDKRYNCLVYNRLWDSKYNYKEGYIFHFIGVVKPWMLRYFSFRAKHVFWKYGRKTFGARKWMCVNILNFFMWPFYVFRRVLFKKGAP